MKYIVYRRSFDSNVGTSWGSFITADSVVSSLDYYYVLDENCSELLNRIEALQEDEGTSTSTPPEFDTGYVFYIERIK